MTTVLIFGITGQDGAFLAEKLINNGAKVFGAARNINNEHNLNALKVREKVSLHECDVSARKAVLDIIDWTCPDEIYHLGGQTSVGESFETPVQTIQANSLSTLYILEAIRKVKPNCKFYNAGSSEIYGNTPQEGANEATPYSPLSPYAVSKIFAVDSVKFYRENYGLYAVNGILFNHESYLRPEKFVTQKIIISAAKIKFGKLDRLELGNLNVSRDWGWAPEFVEAMNLMLKRSDPEDFVIGTGTVTKLEEFVSKVFDYFELDYKKHTYTNPDLVRQSDIKFSKADPSKALKKLKWKANIKLDQAIEKMCEYQMTKIQKRL